VITHSWALTSGAAALLSRGTSWRAHPSFPGLPPGDDRLPLDGGPREGPAPGRGAGRAAL